MSDNPRRWFQIHLSTAIVMMFVAGIAIWFDAPLFDFDSSPNATDEPWDLTGTVSEFSVSLAGDTGGYLVRMIETGEAFEKYELVVADSAGMEKFRQHILSWEHTPFFIRDGIIYYPQYRETANGCKWVAFDLVRGRELWTTRLFGIGFVSHSEYTNQIYCKTVGQRIVVYGDEAAGQYVEILDMRTGRTIANRGFAHFKAFSYARAVTAVLIVVLASMVVGAICEKFVRRREARRP
jgi:hypothetical protein